MQPFAPGPTRPRVLHAALTALVAFVLVGCDDPAALTQPEDLEPFVGQWQGVTIEVEEIAPPNRYAELTSQGASFTLDIEPSGGYTAILTTDRGASVEIGRLELEGSSVTFLREYPSRSESPGTLELLGPGQIRLTGTTRFSFRLGEAPVESRLEVLLQRRP